MEVSIHELKNHLSKYVRHVKMGKTVIVTSHHIPVAKLLPIPTHANEDLQRVLQLEGISWNGKKPKGGKNCPTLKGKTAAAHVIEDRR